MFKLRQILRDHAAMNAVRNSNGDCYLYKIAGKGWHGWDCRLFQRTRYVTASDPAEAILKSYNDISINKINKNLRNKMKEKFCRDCGEKINIKAEICQHCGVRQSPFDINNQFKSLAESSPNGKNQLVAVLFAIFLGSFGIHKFYLDQIGFGILYLLFFWTGIPCIVGIIEGILYLVMTKEEFNRKYGY